MAALCREFEISRKTGYKIFSRYKRCGLKGLADRSRRSRQNCYPCPRNNPSPKCPERTMKVVAEQAVRSELLSADYPVTAMFSGIPWDRGTLARSVSRP